ncbi:MAG TPA: hypothetical protein VII93_04270, partial [Anaerolineales bacterium]
MEDLLRRIQSLTVYQALLDALKTGQALPGLALPRAARLPVLSILHRDLHQPILLVTDRADHALQLHDELASWGADIQRYIFAEPNPLFYEDAAWGSTTRRERLLTLTILASYNLPFVAKPSTPPVIITSARALMTRTLPRRDFLKASKLLKTGQSISPGSLLSSWVNIGYQPVDTVLEPGQISHRGGLLDIWPPSEPQPVRLEFFGDQIETLRRFDPGSQRTIAQLETILIPPAREFLLPDIDSNNNYSSISEFHIPLLHSMPASLLDYLPQPSLVLVDDLGLLESSISEIEEQAVKLRAESIAEGTLDGNYPIPYIPWSELADDLQDRLCLELGRSTAEPLSSSSSGIEVDAKILSEQFHPIQRFGGRLKPFIEFLDKIVSTGKSVTIVSRQSGRLEELWAEQNPAPVDNLHFIEGSLSEGWELGGS